MGKKWAVVVGTNKSGYGGTEGLMTWLSLMMVLQDLVLAIEVSP
jgi:hypothetical protein